MKVREGFTQCIFLQFSGNIGNDLKDDGLQGYPENIGLGFKMFEHGALRLVGGNRNLVGTGIGVPLLGKELNAGNQHVLLLLRKFLRRLNSGGKLIQYFINRHGTTTFLYLKFTDTPVAVISKVI